MVNLSGLVFHVPDLCFIALFADRQTDRQTDGQTGGRMDATKCIISPALRAIKKITCMCTTCLYTTTQGLRLVTFKCPCQSRWTYR